MGSVTVVIPWSPGCPYRERAFAWTRPRWLNEWDVRTGHAPPGPWVKADAVAAGLQPPVGDVVVVADADVWADDIEAAVDTVLSGRARWAVPHTLVKRLDEQSTSRVISANATLGDSGLTFHRRPYGGVIGGGIVVLRGDDYTGCPLDKRFVGWGQEDQAWGTALRCLYGEPWRARGDLWHLWHPPQHRMSLSRGNAAGWSLASRYWRASRSPDAMRKIIAEIGADTGHEPDQRERPGMWAYQNTRTGDVARFPGRNKRLDNLTNWILVEQPEPPVPPITAGNCGGGSTVGAGITDMVKIIGTGDVTTPEPEPEPEPAGPSTPDLPKPAAPKAEWAETAARLGITGASDMTKAQLVEAVRAAATR